MNCPGPRKINELCLTKNGGFLRKEQTDMYAKGKDYVRGEMLRGSMSGSQG